MINEFMDFEAEREIVNICGSWRIFRIFFITKVSSTNERKLKSFSWMPKPIIAESIGVKFMCTQTCCSRHRCQAPWLITQSTFSLLSASHDFIFTTAFLATCTFNLSNYSRSLRFARLFIYHFDRDLSARAVIISLTDINLSPCFEPLR